MAKESRGSRAKEAAMNCLLRLIERFYKSETWVGRRM